MRLVNADEIERTHKGDNWDLHKVLKNAPTVDAVPLSVLEDIKAEIWEVCNNLTYNENHAVGGSWGLRKALDILITT